MYDFDLRTPDGANYFLLAFFDISGEDYIEKLDLPSILRTICG